MNKLCKCEPSRYPHTHNENEGQGTKLEKFVTFKNRDEWLKDHLDGGLYEHRYEFEQGEISGEYYWCQNCGDEILAGSDYIEFELIQKAMRYPFTEEAYYHEDFEMWMGDMPSKILLTPKAADLAWNEVKIDEMEHGVDYRYAKDYE